jgi:hypothetical protein
MGEARTYGKNYDGSRFIPRTEARKNRENVKWVISPFSRIKGFGATHLR